MRQNPCRYCALSSEYKNKRRSGYHAECLTCENRFKHVEYLKAHRKYKEGEPIKSLDELLKQEWVMLYGSTKHIEAIKCLQLRAVLHLIEAGRILKAVENTAESEKQ